ncbi:MAG: SDR family oxidoreductase [Crocinitomicaceae bacterium]|jgi:3-oxoacyl-[acyl-carrier protein] reductase|nr:SDR family oxidoreductase [Crocinitomicaceae bacterium]
MKGKTALVCGSTQGIGKATANKLAANGFNVILLARNEAKLKAVLSELPNDGSQQHHFLVADFTNPAGLKTVLNEYLSKGNKIDALVNNTGGPKGGAIVDAAVEEFIAAFQQHLICNHILVQAVLPGMKANGWGRIVNVISTSVKQPLNNLGVSNTIRGAVANWSKTLANEVGAFNVTVNNVLPGATDTERLQTIAQNKAGMTQESIDAIYKEMAAESPMKRIAKPEEIAAAIDFLLSESASYINGINVPVDGGRTKSL